MKTCLDVSVNGLGMKCSRAREKFDEGHLGETILDETVATIHISAHRFRVLLPERLRLPFFASHRSEMHRMSEPVVMGPQTGRQSERAAPVERVMALICRETGAQFNACLTDMNVRVQANDGRRLKFWHGTCHFGGCQIAVDVTLRRTIWRG